MFTGERITVYKGVLPSSFVPNKKDNMTTKLWFSEVCWARSTCEDILWSTALLSLMGCIYSLKWRYTRNHHSPEEGCSLESRRCWFTVHPSVTVMLFNVVANLWYWNEIICCFHNKSCWKGDGFLVCSYSNAPNFWCVHILLEVLGFF